MTGCAGLEQFRRSRGPIEHPAAEKNDHIRLLRAGIDTEQAFRKNEREDSKNAEHTSYF
ncbi:MAG: hypothetical protein JWR19_2419 [Pedosphaera sp.]|nr:hypothetical protein [Pedosphaera sp.]